MLARLRLWAGLVAGDQQEGGVHDGRSVQHGGHEHVVARTVDEGHVTKQRHRAAAARAFANGMRLCVGTERGVAIRTMKLGKGPEELRRAVRIVALIDLCVGVAQLDSNISLQLVLEAHSLLLRPETRDSYLHARNGLYNGGLSVGDVSNGTCGSEGRKAESLPMLIVAWYCMISGLMGDKLFQSIFVVCSAMLLNGFLGRTRFAKRTAEIDEGGRNAYFNKE